MRAALWLLALFGVAVAAALFAGNNQGTVTLYWPPYRIDLSLNLVVLLLVGGFVTVYAALRALAALLELPHQARRWRVQQKERAMHAALLDALTHMLGGRFIRSRKAAVAALSQENALATAGEAVPHGRQLRALAHMIAAEASHALQDSATRESHLQDALQEAPLRGTVNEQEMREGAQMRAARWSLDDRDANAALDRLAALPQGAARRTLSLRIKLKATRLARQTQEALDTARLLGKHRAFSPAAAQSIVRGLAIELINSAHDTAQLQQTWMSLESSERSMPELAIHAAQRLAALGGAEAGARTRSRAGRPRRPLAGAHRVGLPGKSPRRPPAVPGGHGLPQAPAVGQGPAVAHTGGAATGRQQPAGQRLAPPGRAGRKTRRRQRRRRGLEEGRARPVNGLLCKAAPSRRGVCPLRQKNFASCPAGDALGRTEPGHPW